MITSQEAKFYIGQVVHHKLFDYHGVIVDVDPSFEATDEWYELMAKSRPPKDKPWYHVLVHQSIHTTYVAEQNLESEDDPFPLDHPEIDDYFSDFVDGKYVLLDSKN